jgi:hypothetical protein
MAGAACNIGSAMVDGILLLLGSLKKLYTSASLAVLGALDLLFTEQS